MIDKVMKRPISLKAMPVEAWTVAKASAAHRHMNLADWLAEAIRLKAQIEAKKRKT